MTELKIGQKVRITIPDATIKTVGPDTMYVVFDDDHGGLNGRSFRLSYSHGYKIEVLSEPKRAEPPVGRMIDLGQREDFKGWYYFNTHDGWWLINPAGVQRRTWAACQDFLDANDMEY